ncbi:MAG TPA: hypothetical protein ENH02_01015 [Bacteroidetes bacterium]|nr:hypothetical protein [Bacteroidota bacterium]
MHRAGILLGILFLVEVALAQKVSINTYIPGLPGDSLVTIGSLTMEGNKITQDKIILREIEFKPGDVLSIATLDSLMVKSRQNLLNRSLFNFVSITKTPDNGKYDIRVNVVERWYIWPIPVITFADRNVNVWWQDKDFNRLNYGIDLQINNFRGRMEDLHFYLQGGYDKVFALRWDIPYLTKKQFFGMGFYGGIQLNREVAYATENDDLVYYKTNDGFAQERGFGEVDLTFRPKYNYLHTLTFGYDHYFFEDTLLNLNPGFANRNEYNILSISYLYKQDFRDYKPYPLIGYYFDAGFVKYGMGLIPDQVNSLVVTFVFDQYVQLYKRWYFAYDFTASFTSNELPYFLTTGLGYRGLEIRGYEFNIVSGQDFGLFKSNLKFEIIPRTVKRIKWIKTEKFGKIFYALYANLFFDAGYANAPDFYETNHLANQLLWGTGVGIDFITYYDLVFRFEYSINKQGKTGFYIHLVAPI